MITRGVRRQNKARREFLREPCDGLIVFGNACNSVANAKKFFEALAGFPAFAETFAQAAQVSRHLPRRLRRLREAPGIYRDVCAGCASSTAFTETFAQAARGSRHLPRRLRRLREAPGIRRDVCGTPANAKKFLEAFAAFLQRPKSFSRHLQHSCKDQKVSRGICSVAAKHFQKLCAAFRALSKTFFRDTDPHSFAELAFGMCFVQIFCIVRSMYAHCEGVQIDIPSIFAPNKRDFT